MTMRIARVGIRNLRSYRSAELPLSAGTTLLSGDIGSGKTTILYAIEMALFGFAEVEPGYLIRHGAREAEVSATLTDGTTHWEWRRRFVRRARKGRETFDPAESSLTVDGHRTVYSATELRRRTIEMLGFPDNPNPRARSDVWRWAVYLAQERMRDVLGPDVDVRMDTVRKALGVEQYRLAGENARGLSRTLGERAGALTDLGARHEGVEAEALRWRAAEAEARASLVALEAREGVLRADIASARAELDAVEGDRRASESMRETLLQQERLAAELQRSIDQDHAALEAARQLLGRLEADRTLESKAGLPEVSGLAPLRARREELLRERSLLEAERAQQAGVDEQLERGKERERELAARRRTSRKELTEARAERLELEAAEPVQMPHAPEERSALELAAERGVMEEARRALDRKMATAVAELQQLEQLFQEGVCPRCHRPVEASEFASHRREQEFLVAGLQRDLTEASGGLESMDARIAALGEYARLRDRWDQLERRRADQRQRETKLRAAIVEEDSIRAKLSHEREALEARRQALVSRLPEFERVRHELARLESEVLDAEERARAAAARAERLAAIERRIPEVRSEIDLRVREETGRSARRDEVHRQIEEGRERLARLPDSEARWTECRARVDELGRELEGLLREASGPRGRMGEAAARLDELARRLKEREEFERESARLRSLSEWVDGEFRAAMLELERRRLAQGRRQFEGYLARYFSALVEDPSLTARVDDSFAPSVDLAGVPTPAEALSGGERTALALAYRLALGRVVRDAGRLKLETLLLDEPTEGFSQEQAVRMGDLLEELGLPQVVLVSHERQLEGIADRVVRVRKTEGISYLEGGDGEGGGNASASLPVTPAAAKPSPSPVRRRRIRRLTDLEAAPAGDGAAQVK